MPALIKSALQRIKDAVEAARAGQGTQHLPADALYEAWQSPYNSQDLLNLKDLVPSQSALITDSPLAQWLRAQNIGVRMEGPPSFSSARHYDATGGRQSFDMPTYWYYQASEPKELRWMLGELPTRNIKNNLYVDDPNMEDAVVRGAYGYVNGSEGGQQLHATQELMEQAAQRSWADMLRDPELRLRANLSYALPRTNALHKAPLVKAKKTGGSV